MIELFDAHCHLQDSRIAAYTVAVLDAARQAGVVTMAVNGCHEGDWQGVQDLCERHPAQLVPNFGLHPWWVSTRSAQWLAKLEALLQQVPNSGLGECGLDYSLKGSATPSSMQEHVLVQQMQLARRLHRPLSVHCVKAASQLLKLVQREGPFPAGLILHSFLGPADLIRPFAAVDGVHFSISGHSLRSPKRAPALVSQIPSDRLLLETDSPDAQPGGPADLVIKLPGMADQRHNQPANVRAIAQAVAELRQEPLERVSAVTTQTAHRLFTSFCCSQRAPPELPAAG